MIASAAETRYCPGIHRGFDARITCAGSRILSRALTITS